jgi:hypothetical protein
MPPEAAAEPGPGRGSRRALVRDPDPSETEERGSGTRAARAGARASKRRVKVWLVAIIVIAIVAAGTAGVALYTSRSGAPRSHMLVAPSKLGNFVRRPQLEQRMNARQLQQQVIDKSAGQASHVVSAVYENSGAVSGSAPPQIILFIGGNLAGVSPAGFISSFTTQFRGTAATSAGPLGGQAACVEARVSPTGSAAMCTWADADTFGVVVSPTMSPSQLATQMRTIRPSVERPLK